MRRMVKMVSIIIPVYNVEKYLEACIKSAINQTYPNIEVILIDDGSTDSSGNICDSYALNDSRIKVIHKHNQGLSAARNDGLDISKGEYVFFLDSDDYLNENAISVMVDKISKNNADIVMCGYNTVDESGNNIIEQHFDDVVLYIEDCFDYMFSGKEPLLAIVSWNKLYDRTIFDDLRFPVSKIHEDEFVAHLVYSKIRKAIVSPETLYNYRKREGSIMSKEPINRRFDAVEAFYNRSRFFANTKRWRLLGVSLVLAINYLGDIYPKLNNEHDIITYHHWKTEFRTLWFKHMFRILNLKRQVALILYFINDKLYPKAINSFLNAWR